ncbi:MAG: sulfotransferase [Synergistaceae bacterium]|nr:sulfotransferase [Synergistaceae bacterium]
MELKYVVVSGYVTTGASAVTDLLKEYEGFWEAKVEFRLIKDPYCLIDLRHHIIDCWDPLYVDNAIKDFMWAAKHLNHVNSKLSLTSGLGYGSRKVFGDNFLRATYKFLGDIINYQYLGTWWMTDFKSSKFEVLKRKIKRKLKIKLNDTMYFSACTPEKFDAAVAKYLDNLFFNGGITRKTCVLDQGFPAQQPELLNNFLPNSKMIVVDRDPRDVYTEMYRSDPLLKYELQKNHNVDLFVEWYKGYRKNADTVRKNTDVLIVNFEDVVLNYESTKEKLEKFLGLKDKQHLCKKTLFIPENSSKNIGKWKDFIFQEDIRKVEQCLPEYLWNE